MNKNFQIHYVEDYAALSEQGAVLLLDAIVQNPQAVIVLATGYSPLGTYRRFVELVRKRKTDVSRVTFIKLDEWLGLPPDNPATCQYFIEHEMLAPLGLPAAACLSFDGTAPDPDVECRRIAARIEELPAIDLMILGVGKNAHLGLNEPADHFTLPPHPVLLGEMSRQHAMLRTAGSNAQKGITLGLQSIFQARQVLLLVAGTGKEQAFASLLNDEVSPQFPVSIMKLHPNCLCLAEARFGSTGSI